MSDDDDIEDMYINNNAGFSFIDPRTGKPHSAAKIKASKAFIKPRNRIQPMWLRQLASYKAYKGKKHDHKI